MNSGRTTLTAPIPSDGFGHGFTPWRFVMIFGGVSLLMDFVYEGARSGGQRHWRGIADGLAIAVMTRRGSRLR